MAIRVQYLELSTKGVVANAILDDNNLTVLDHLNSLNSVEGVLNRSLGLHDDAAFHVVGENVLCGAEGGSGNVQILQTHFLHQHLADHIVPVQNGINYVERRDFLGHPAQIGNIQFVQGAFFVQIGINHQ